MKRLANYVYLSIGSVLLLLGWWNPPVAIAAWLAPVFLIRFARATSPIPGLLMMFAASYGACLVSVWQRMAPVTPYPVQIDLLITLQFMPTHLLPYLADRLMSPRLKDAPASLVFPLSTIAIAMANYHMLGDPGSGVFLEKFYGVLPFQQLLSLTGQWGPIFILAWTGPILNLVWERGGSPAGLKGVPAVFAGVIAALLILGGVRLSFFPPTSRTVRIAAVTSSVDASLLRDFMPSITARQRPPQEAIAAFEQRIEKTNSELNVATRSAVATGARIVVWNELATIVDYEREGDFIKTYRVLARETGVYLVLCLGVFDPDMKVMAENVLYVIDPSGTPVARYRKRHRVPVLETAIFKEAVDPVPVVKTPYGTMAAVICYDGLFHDFVRSAARGADILLNPSLDWEGITPVNAWRFTFRAVENGFSFVRSTGHGLSLAVDHQGRLLSSLDYFRSDARIMIADVPTRGVPTTYGRVGELFGWMAVAGCAILAALAGFAAVKKR